MHQHQTASQVIPLCQLPGAPVLLVGRERIAGAGAVEHQQYAVEHARTITEWDGIIGNGLRLETRGNLLEWQCDILLPAATLNRVKGQCGRVAVPPLLGWYRLGPLMSRHWLLDGFRWTTTGMQEKEYCKQK